MTTTDQFGGSPPPSPTDPKPPGSRVLRRSRTDRVGAGVAGGLGEYFNVDPVLFRVLFATAAFFGGAGVLAYLVAWAAIPEQGTVNAPVDRFVSELRRRRVPVWVIAVVGGLALWVVAFSWWAPGHFILVAIVAIVVVASFGRRGWVSQRGHGPGTSDQAAASATVDLTKDGAPGTAGPAQPGARSASPTWLTESRQWFAEAKQASRLRHRRAMPVRLATLGALAVTLTILGLIDAANGIALPDYFWATLVIVGLGMLVGIALRRTPWTLTSLLVLACIGLVAFAGSGARLHDGIGSRDWTPTSSAALQSHYRLAFGQATLDLRHLGTLAAPRTVDVTLGAGEVRLLVPSTMNVTVQENVHFGDLQLDNADLVDNGGRGHGGVGLYRTILPPAGASGAALTIDVHLTDGRISVERD